MDGLVDVFQYAGCLAILCSIFGYRYKHLMGPKLGCIGSSMLIFWAGAVGAWGLFGLNIVCLAVYAWTWKQWITEINK